MTATRDRDGRTGADEGCVEFRLSRHAAWHTILATGCAGIVVIGIVAAGGRTDILPIVVLAVVAGLGYGLHRLSRASEDGGVRLRFDREGIWAPAFGGAPIPWRAIAGLDLVHSRSGHHLLIDLREADADHHGDHALLDSRRRRVVHLDPLLKGGPSKVRMAIARFAPQFVP